MGLDLERLVEMQQGPVQLPHARTHVSQPPRRVNTRRDSRLERPMGGWEAGAGGTSEPMSRLLGVERRPDRGQELNSSPALPPRLLPPSQTFRCFTHAQESRGFYIQSTCSAASGCLCWEEIKSAAVSANLCNREDLGNTEEETSERETLGEEQNKQDVSSFRFTVVVGEIWLCSYSTLRTGQEEEGDRFTW